MIIVPRGGARSWYSAVAFIPPSAPAWISLLRRPPRSDRREIGDVDRDGAILVVSSFASRQKSTRLYRRLYSQSAPLGALKTAGCDAACRRAACLRLRGRPFPNPHPQPGVGCNCAPQSVARRVHGGLARAILQASWTSVDCGRAAFHHHHHHHHHTSRRRQAMVAGSGGRKSWRWCVAVVAMAYTRLRSLALPAAVQLAVTVQSIPEARLSTRSEARHLLSGCFK